MKLLLSLIVITTITACDPPKPVEPRFISVTDCVSNKSRDVEVCTSPGGAAVGWAIGGALLLGPIGLLAGVPSATQDKKCHMEKEEYCEKYETHQIPNKNYIETGSQPLSKEKK